MKTKLEPTVAALLLAILNSSATTLYVSLQSEIPTPPYSSWVTAARVIQDAIDAAQAGDTVLVTNGTYATGGRAVPGSMTNRVALTKPLLVQSVNGPQFTVIQGQQAPGTTNGDGAIRCAYLADGASLCGFTLTNGATLGGGGEADWNGGGLWAASTQALVSNCVVVGNSAYNGGGAFGGTINTCDFTSNTAQFGGGGADSSVLINCTLTGNSAYVVGGGAENCTLNRCVLKDNSAQWDGGGTDNSMLNNCFLSKNSAGYGGAANGGTLLNCTVVANSARYGGGVFGSSVTNGIVYFNDGSDWANYDETSKLSFCCTTPQPSAGIGNLTADPQLATSSHLSAGSPCRAKGSSVFVTGVDIDGEPWASPPSMGCDEYYPGALAVPLQVDFLAAFTNVAVSQSIALIARIDGLAAASAWTFGDGMTVSNRPYVDHAWESPGDYAVVLSAYNGTYPEGASVTGIVHVVVQPIHYVASDSSQPVPPYTSWETAATNLQDAVDAATVAGALILVTNGVYSTEGRSVQDAVTNQVTLNKPVTLRSMNGPDVTMIVGAAADLSGSGQGPSRCAYVGSAAVLSGFTLTNGFIGGSPGYCDSSKTGGGAWCEPLGTLTNCIISGNSACLAGAVYGGKIHKCVLIGNWAFTGGGAVDATLYGCKLEGNNAAYAGGASGGTLYHCSLTSNSAGGYYKSAGYGGGASGSTLYGCTLVGNAVAGAGVSGGGSAGHGGGASGCVLHNCTLIGNSSAPNFDGFGGGASGSLLYNCALFGNTAGLGGGGVSEATLYNCTLSGNSCASPGGGTYRCAVYNSIVFHNNAPANPNWSGTDSTLNYCCTTPLPPTGVGNLDLDPQLTSASHLSASSPCRAAGNVDYTAGVDVDGEPWANPPSIGCDEYYVGSVTGVLTVSLSATLTNVAVHYPVGLSALIEGRTTSSVWDFDDGVRVTNRPTITHAWSAPGEYAVLLWAYNESYPAGVSASVTVRVEEGIYYVATESVHPQPPYDSWATAARNIQDAVDAVKVPAAVVLVTNGLYATGGRKLNGAITNRVAVSKPITVQSVNGPQFTIIQGYQAPGITNGEGGIRCVYLVDGASLSGFTLTNGSTGGVEAEYPDLEGGGVFCEAQTSVVSNCVVTGNWGLYGGGASGGTLENCTLWANKAEFGGGASGATLNNCSLSGNTAESGGGAYASTLNNCELRGNYAANSGGGTYSSGLWNCTLVGNSASAGGGLFESFAENCIVYYNTAQSGGNFYESQFYGGSLDYCCTTPQPSMGIGSITGAPLFMDYVGGDLRLQSNSPCINSGLSVYAPGAVDLDGNQRVVNNTVDIGAYEFQGPGSVISYAWLQQYGLPTDGSADLADTDGDGMNNWQEWRCGTRPTNALSALRLQSAYSDGTNVTVTWQSVAGVNYFVQRSTNLAGIQPFTFLVMGIPGQPGTTSFTDSGAASLAPLFYRVGVSSQ